MSDEQEWMLVWRHEVEQKMREGWKISPGYEWAAHHTARAVPMYRDVVRPVEE